MSAQTPVIDRIVPAAIRVREATTVTVFGENLANATTLWASFPAAVSRPLPLERNGSTASRVVFWVSVPGDAPVGIGAVRLVTTNGVSNLHALMVDDLPSVTASGTNKTLEAAQLLRAPIAVDGTCDERKSDYYQITGRKGGRIYVDVAAARIGSSLDPVLRVLDGNGLELAYCDDAPDTGPDPHLEYRFATSGRFFIELRDTRYAGGPKHAYRLRLSSSQLRRVPFLPLAGVRRRRMAGEGAAEFPEIEPNDSPALATKLSLPAIVTGRFARPNDRDFFEFTVQKGERWVFAGRTRSLGSPCDLYLSIQRPDGSTVMSANPAVAEEGGVTNTFVQGGRYRLLVEELNHRGGSGLSYRVEITAHRPGFELSVEADTLEAPAGGSCEVKVIATRRDYDGPINLRLDPPGEGFLLANAVIAAKTNTALLQITVPASLKAGQVFQLGVVGQASVDGTDFEAQVSTLPAVRRLFPLLLYPPRDLDGWIALGIRPGESANSKPAGTE